jgi:hypothetical protein
VRRGADEELSGLHGGPDPRHSRSSHLPFPAERLAEGAGEREGLHRHRLHRRDPLCGRHILLLDDIIDTGITLSFLLDHIRDHSPASLRVCALIDKPGARKIDVRPDWTAFKLEEPFDRFIVGYGLDYQERYRELPYLATIPIPPPSAAGRRIALPGGSA